MKFNYNFLWLFSTDIERKKGLENCYTNWNFNKTKRYQKIKKFLSTTKTNSNSSNVMFPVDAA